jgi:ribosomal protein L40E
MNLCAKCGAENPPGSKFCAGCGTVLPNVELCSSCGTESPAGSRFCKGCGKPLGGNVAQNSPGAASGSQPSSQSIQHIRGMLIAGAFLYATGIFLMYSEIDALQSAYGAYASFVANTDMQWFLIVVDLVCAGLGLYAITQVNNGQYKLAKTMFIVMVVLGALFLLRGFSGPIFYSLLNAALLAVGIWGWRLILHEEKAVL